MHLHKIVAQILLILSILNSVLAAPVVRVREIPRARGAVAVRVPAEGVVSVLEKRPYLPQWLQWWGASAAPSPEQPQSTANHEHPESQSTQPPELTETEEVYHDASEGPPSNAAWRQKIMTPGKIKAAKYVGITSLLTAAYLSLLLPKLTNNNGEGNHS
ncbi:hypothetical protein V8E52_007346 [Russula decolorans]|jgi:hypothetical protein